MSDDLPTQVEQHHFYLRNDLIISSAVLLGASILMMALFMQPSARDPDAWGGWAWLIVAIGAALGFVGLANLRFAVHLPRDLKNPGRFPQQHMRTPPSSKLGEVLWPACYGAAGWLILTGLNAAFAAANGAPTVWAQRANYMMPLSALILVLGAAAATSFLRADAKRAMSAVSPASAVPEQVSRRTEPTAHSDQPGLDSDIKPELNSHAANSKKTRENTPEPNATSPAKAGQALGLMIIIYPLGWALLTGACSCVLPLGSVFGGDDGFWGTWLVFNWPWSIVPIGIGLAVIIAGYCHDIATSRDPER